ncbi:MAG: hypothetical protein JSR37_00035 [Verrucomicrobia bacterium]|nr:hypothetical protein [Verrucomicrobiota bacterium]MBS0637730.1 hypothetical protein [Verrucomicrobiota bacterium]
MTLPISNNPINFSSIEAVDPTTDKEDEDIELQPLVDDKVITLTEKQVRELKINEWKNNWWRIHEAEDAEEKEDKTARKLMPVGAKQYIALGATCAAATALQFIFEEEPIMSGTVGAAMNAWKIVYIQTTALKDTRIPQNVMRGIALTMLTAATIFRYVPDDPIGVIPVLRKLPLTDASLAIFAKCDLNSLKLDQKLIALFRRCCNTQVPATAAKVITLVAQASVMGVLMSIPNIVGSYLAAGAAVLKKAQWRRVTDIVWQAVDRIEDPVKRRIGIATAIGSSVIVTGACAYAASTTLFQNPYFKWLPVAVGIVTFDITSRTGKQIMNAYALPEDDQIKEKLGVPEDVEIKMPAPTVWSRCSTILQTVGLLGATAGISAAVGPTMIHRPGEESVTTTPGILVTACQEAGSYLKVATGMVFEKSKAAFAATVGLLGAGTGVYLARNAIGIDRYITPGYGAGVFALASVFTTALYLDKAFLKADKKPKLPKT